MRKILQFIKWLYPGMKIKRWILLSALGIFMVAMGSVKALSKEGPLISGLGVGLLLMGIMFIILGTKYMVRSFVSLFIPQKEKELVDIVYRKRHLERGPKIVVIGGGTGLAVLLHGLKEYTSNITAIVTVADEGGSSGKLRDQFDTLPPGDIRNCLVALADAEPLMRELFQFRFEKDSDLQGHNFGNLFITALTKITGDFEKAVKASSKVLAIRGQVIPATLNKVRLVAEHIDGSKTVGEADIPNRKSPIKRIYLTPANSGPCEEALEAIYQAEVIIYGPGSLYTSVIPNLLVRGIREAILRSKALKIYICNVMTQSGETDNYTASEHLKALIEHSHPGIVEVCIVNTGEVPTHLLAKYKQENAFPVINDSEEIKRLGYRVIEENVINTTNFVRHNPMKLAKSLMEIISDSKHG